MTEPQPPQTRPVAQPPQGSMAQPGSGEVLFEGIAKHSASLGGYLKWTLVTLVAGAIAIFINMMEWGVPGWILGLLWLVGVPGLAWTYLEHTSTKFKITGRRVETEHGVLGKSVDSLELWRVLDVKYTQSVLDRLLGNGRITLISTDQSDPNLDLHGLPNHRALFEKLRDAVQDARQTNRPMELVGNQELDAQGGQTFEQLS
ncbi:PH domain-containing protein [Pseudenhygromyxa sp. WMMC2535]|uniref:PH domain-containing protein n=1 Tax=Pseudenhygromyxa sp. WMMC2535 TaxID=2712867 RepID=UPI00155777D1|nr:PH domain-containing protein [Pseudenhygromyxa sp. WMMC2535]NVB37876.1 PH domain-containing protein [Pseudenhygromyxa sp. WMMC2535]